MLFKEPDEESKAIMALSMNDLLKITGARIGENDSTLNRLWYEIEGKGFVHSQYIQPVRNYENKTNTVIPEYGCQGEITMLFVDAFRQMDKNSPLVYRLYFASTYSDGCINLTPEAVKWVYLWTTPAVLPKDYIYADDNGTRVTIH